MKIQLSISMLVSDRSETLKKCLASLKGLLRELSCELIVVFTGEKKETLEIVKQYTDHIMPFKWCDDFSAARNVGLKEACGEWFMFLDDDEWFENTDEIITFFKNGECDNYQSASYIQRNYRNLEGRDYSDAYVKRIYKNDGNLAFISSIHEYIPKALQPTKSLSSYVHHYGYVKSDKNQSPRYERNIPLLLDEIEKNPTLTKNYMQLAQEYKAARNFEKAEEYCRKGLALSEKASVTYTVDFWMMAYLPTFISLQGDNQRALKEAECLIKNKKMTELVKAYLYITASVLCLTINECSKGIEYVKCFHELWGFLHRNEEATHRQDCGDINLSTVDKMAYKVYMSGLNMAVKEKDFQLVAQILQWIPWVDENTMKNYYSLLEKWKNNFLSENVEILKCFEELPDKTTYLLLQKALYAETQNQMIRLKELLGQCKLEHAKELSCINYQIIGLALRNDIDVIPYLKDTSLEHWGAYALQIVKDTETKKMEIRLEKIKNTLQDYPLYCSVFEQSFLEKQMLFGWLDNEELICVAERYCDVVIAYYKEFYMGKYFTEDFYNMLPSKCVFSLFLQKALNSLKKNQLEAYIKNLRKALYAYPELSVVINKLLKHLENQQNLSSGEGTEFMTLGRKIKDEIKLLISKEQYIEANIILMKLLQILPEDLELLKLKQQILASE